MEPKWRLEASLEGQVEPKWRLEASLEGKMEFKWRSEASLKAKLASKWCLEASWKAQVALGGRPRGAQVAPWISKAGPIRWIRHRNRRYDSNTVIYSKKAVGPSGRRATGEGY